MITPHSYFDVRFTHDSGRSRVWKAICGYLQKFIGPNTTVLDIGAGYCSFINNIVASRKIAIDLSSESSKYAGPDVTFFHQSILDKWPVDANSADIVFASNFFEHFDDNELCAITDQIQLVLKKGGKLILIQPNYYYAYREYWDDYTHKKAFSHNSLADFLKSRGFTIRRVEQRFLPFSMKSLLPKSYWLTRLYLFLPFRFNAKQMLIVAEK